MITVRFMGQRCTLEWGQYASPRNPRLQLWTIVVSYHVNHSSCAHIVHSVERGML
jgi:hypothetical protein